jgi:hypothetical protein
LKIGPGLTEASASRELASMSAMYCSPDVAADVRGRVEDHDAGVRGW